MEDIEAPLPVEEEKKQSVSGDSVQWQAGERLEKEAETVPKNGQDPPKKPRIRRRLF